MGGNDCFGSKRSPCSELSPTFFPVLHLDVTLPLHVNSFSFPPPVFKPPFLFYLPQINTHEITHPTFRSNVLLGRVQLSFCSITPLNTLLICWLTLIATKQASKHIQLCIYKMKHHLALPKLIDKTLKLYFEPILLLKSVILFGIGQKMQKSHSVSQGKAFCPTLPIFFSPFCLKSNLIYLKINK